MRRGGYAPIALVMVAVGAALGVAFASPIVGISAGVAVGAALLWEHRHSSRR